MEQITVPQFIENEDKILGPLTVRQFGILFVGGVLIFIVFKLLDFTLFVFAAIIIVATAGTLAFYKVNGRPVHFFIVNIGQTMQRPSLRVWKRNVDRASVRAIRAQEAERLKFFQAGEKEKIAGNVPKKHYVSEQRLSEIALLVDTGGAYHPDSDDKTELF
ncbi:PrgI family protein [Candidatus Uhrbacteria bacterium]|nr:PrgI family protein [Candidatus Uhrbacteria bacterium]